MSIGPGAGRIVVNQFPWHTNCCPLLVLAGQCSLLRRTAGEQKERVGKMKIITVSGFKGGTGKTTISALIGVAAVQEGLRVAALDLDRFTSNLSRFLHVRKDAGLESPDHFLMMETDKGGDSNSATGRLFGFVEMARIDGYDLMIIDTSSGHQKDIYDAHLIADVILTPMNESPADMHALFTPSGAPMAPRNNYRDLVDAARFDRARAGKPKQRWSICVNRVQALPTRIGAAVQQRVENMARDTGFDDVWYMRERVAHRAISEDGHTVLDTPTEGRLTMSEISGRSELRGILSQLTDGEMELTAQAA